MRTIAPIQWTMSYREEPLEVGTERKQVLLLLPSSNQTLSSGVGQVPSLLLDFPFGARKDGLGLK